MWVSRLQTKAQETRSGAVITFEKRSQVTLVCIIEPLNLDLTWDKPFSSHASAFLSDVMSFPLLSYHS